MERGVGWRSLFRPESTRGHVSAWLDKAGQDRPGVATCMCGFACLPDARFTREGATSADHCRGAAGGGNAWWGSSRTDAGWAEPAAAHSQPNPERQDISPAWSGHAAAHRTNRPARRSDMPRCGWSCPRSSTTSSVGSLKPLPAPLAMSVRRLPAGTGGRHV